MGSDLSRTRTFKHLTGKLASSEMAKLPPDNGAGGSTWMAIFKVMDTPYTVEFQVSDEITLGRNLTAHGGTHDYHIDLSKFQAEHFGVSRRHAAVCVYGQHLVLRDLESTNGTFLNGYRLPPLANMPFKERDVIEMGKLRLQVVFAAQV